MLVLLSGGRFSNFALIPIKNPGCVAEFWAAEAMLFCSASRMMTHQRRGVTKDLHKKAHDDLNYVST